MDLIEQALRMAMSASSADPQDDTKDTIRRMHDLLGRLHDQKIFYRPRDGVYVGG